MKIIGMNSEQKAKCQHFFPIIHYFLLEEQNIKELNVSLTEQRHKHKRKEAL